MFELEKARLKVLVRQYWSLSEERRTSEEGEAIFAECERTYDELVDRGLDAPLAPDCFIYPEATTDQYETFVESYFWGRTRFRRVMRAVGGERIQRLRQFLGVGYAAASHRKGAR
jgi:hypothetical protein